MYSSVTICGREGSNYPGGGVTVQGGTFHMHGGTIENCGINSGSVCYGGGVGVVDDYYTGAGGTFIMDGGEITGCYAIAPSVPGLTFQSYGGGVFVAYGSSFTMNGGTISGNRADVGGGVMLSDNSAEMKIGGGSITGNTATICGGGLAAVENDGAVVVNNAKLCNNVANGAASDVYLANTPAQLSPAGNMGENYLGAPDDVYGSRIDGWYFDNEDSRYASQQAGERQAFGDYTSIGTSDSVSLIAASNNRLVKVSFTNEDGSVTYGEGWYEPGTKADKIQVPTPTKDSDDTFDYEFAGWDSEIADVTVETVYKAQFSRLFKVFGARYEFSCATPGQQLPDEVLALLPADDTPYPRGSEISALAPSQTSVETADGTWTFVGYDRTIVEASMDNADNEGNVHFSGTWKFTRKPTPAQPGDGGATAGANPAGKADGASSEGAQLPQTSDAFGPGALLALIAAGATSLIAAAAIRE
ncbi:SHIRT domain-containing protein [Parolsenella catena]|uniref:SHIRT domain-containing protein n=1 Tax=Parolsenella catena TaxID=2003188 RepID=UPI002FDA44D1